MSHCQNKNELKLYKKDFKVYIPKNYLSNCKISKKMFKCSIVPPLNDTKVDTLPIKWTGLPKKTQTILIEIVDTTCTYMCNKSCKFTHWKCKLNLKEAENLKDYSEIFYTNKGEITGIKLNGIKYLSRFNLTNSAKLKNYIPFCAPDFQTHAHVILITAFDKNKNIIGKSQSIPFLI